MELVTYDNILEGVRKTREWYRQLGIRTSGSRLEEIENHIVEILQGIQQRQPEDFLQGRSRDRDFYALSDGAGFGLIYEELHTLRSDRLPRRVLTEAIRGPLSPTEERPGTEDVHARNFFIELELAAKLSRKGLRIHRFDDVQFEFRQIPFSIQCKRLGSRRSIAANIQRAYGQLLGVMTDDGHKGLIALSVEKIFGLEGPWLPVVSEGDITREIYNWTRAFAGEHHDAWMSFEDRRVIGLLLIFKLLCHTLPQNVVGPAYYPVIIPLVHRTSADFQILLDLKAVLEEP